MTEKLPYEIISRSVNPATDIQTEPPSQSVMDFMNVWTKNSYSEPLVDDGKIHLMIYITKSTKIGQRLGARHHGPASVRLIKRRVYARQMNRTFIKILKGCYPVSIEG